MACIVPFADFVAAADAEAIHKAFEGLEDKKEVLVNILPRRTINQRKLIAQAYKTVYGKDLLDHLRHKLHGMFQDVVIWSFYSRPQLNAAALNFAIGHLDTDKKMLIDVLCTVTNHEMDQIKECYLKLYQTDMEQAITGAVHGDLKNLFSVLMQAQRENDCNQAQAKGDAQELYDVRNAHKGQKENSFTNILCSRSYEEIKLINDFYLGLSGESLEDAIKKELHGDYKDALLRIVDVSMNRCDTIAEMYYDSMVGAGTRDHSIMRLTLEHAEINLGKIRAIFAQKYGQTLAEMVKCNTSGDYQDFMLAIIEQNP